MSSQEKVDFGAKVSQIYSESKYKVGAENNGAFVPDQVSSLLAKQLSEQFGWSIKPEYFLPAFWLKKVPLYPDADTFLRKLGSKKDIVTLIYTQGEVFDHGMVGDTKNHGYQNHKIEVAGIPWYFGPDNREILQKHGLNFVHGHFYKTTESCLNPLLEFVKQNNLDVNYFDDVAKNHEEVGAYFCENGVVANLYWLNRNRLEKPSFSVDVEEIESFDCVELDRLLHSLTLLDLDGTLINSMEIRAALHANVLEYAQRLQEQS